MASENHKSRNRKSYVQFTFYNILIALIVLILGKLSYLLKFNMEGMVLPIYLPAGFNLAVLLGRNRKYAIGIFFGTALEALLFLLDSDVISWGFSLLSIVLVSIVNTMQPLLCVYLLEKFCSKKEIFFKLHYLFRYILIVHLVCIIGALAIALSLFIRVDFNNILIFQGIFDWWVSNVAGIIIISPVLILLEVPDYYSWKKERIIEMILFLLLTGMFYVFFILGINPIFESVNLAYIIIPFIIWAVIRFSPRFAVIQIFIIYIFTITGLVVGNSPFFENNLYDSLIMTQLFLFVISITNLYLIAMVTQRKIALIQLKSYSDNLEDRVEEALSEIKVLSGFLPICSLCKKIRDEDGTWHQIETYIDNHSEAKFSHSYCPECAKDILNE